MQDIEKWGMWQDELELVFSLMSDKQLMEMRDMIEGMIRERVYEKEGFPLSCGGLRGLQSTIMFAFWVRRGKGIKIVDGEVEVCELKESPFWKRYHAPALVEGRDGERYDPDAPDHERDIPDVREEGEFI